MDAAPTKPLFDLTLTDEQQLMRETLRRFVQGVVRPAARGCDEAAALAPDLAAEVQRLGLLAMQIPEACSGLGAPRSPISNLLLCEDLAYGDMALAIAALGSLSFVNTVLDQGTPAQQQALLPPFAQGAPRAAALALLEPGARFDARRLATRARKQGSGFVLSGQKAMVPFGAEADALLVIADLEGEGPSGFVVHKGQDGVSFEREAFMGLRALPLYGVTLRDAQVPAQQRLGEGRPFDLARVLDLCRIGGAALAVGTCKAVLDYVKGYVNERIAFGEPISHRQSVAFMVADMAIELDGLRLLTYRAASRAEQGLPFRREAYLASLQAAEHGMKIGTDGVQLLGGHGFIREHPVELWYRNLRAIPLLDGMVSV